MGRFRSLVLAFFCLLSLSAFGQYTVTVTADAKTLLGTNDTSNVKLCLSLVDGSGQQVQNPRVINSGVLVSTETVCVTPDANGHISTTAFANDQILPLGTMYVAEWYKNGLFKHGDQFLFNLADGTENLNSKASIMTTAIVAAPTGDTTYCRIDGSNCGFTGPITTHQVSASLSNTYDLLNYRDATFGRNLSVGGPNPFGDVTNAINGLTCDGATDDTAAFNSAVTRSCNNFAMDLWIPKGKTCRLASAPNPIPCGTHLLGSYSKGAAFGYGSFIKCDYTESTSTNGCLWWNGANASSQGNGGGIRGINIQKGDGKTGGVAIKLSGTDCTARSGNFHVDGVKVSSNTGTWNYGLYVDGTTCTTSGTQGNRDNHFSDLEIFSTTTKAISLNNAVHNQLEGITTSIGAGSNAGMDVTGTGAGTSASTDDSISDSEISGNLTVDNATTFRAVGVDVTGTVTSTANNTASVFVGTATTLSISGGMGIIANDTGAGTSQGAALTNTLRAQVGIVAGTTYPTSLNVGDIAADADFVLNKGTDGTYRIRRNNGSATNTNICLMLNSTCLYNFDLTNGFSTSLNIGSTLASGTVPMTFASRAAGVDPVQNLTVAHHPIVEACGTTTTCAQTKTDNIIIVYGQVSLSSGTPSTATITSLPYTNSTSYFCTATEAGGVAAVKVVNSSGSQTVITGVNTVTDPVNYHCIGT